VTTFNSDAFLKQLTSTLDPHSVLTDADATSQYRHGFRSGGGDALCVIFPNNLVQLWRALQVCVEADVIVIMQASNTGLTEGSTPSGNDYDRPIAIIKTSKLDQYLLIDDAQQVISFPGTTLFQLEDALKPLGKEPHSVIGSSCIGASVIGGIANNSGGALIQRGPAYTELSLYAQIDDQGELHLVNHLGIDLGNEPEEMLTNLQDKNFKTNTLTTQGKLASDQEYKQRVRQIDEDTPARFNADKRRLFEASGCAGKLAIFAVRSDTFDQPKRTKTFYLGVNDPAIFTHLRRDMLKDFKQLPVSAEYVHGTAFDIAHQYGKDNLLAIEKLGTSSMPRLFSLKNKIATYLDKQKWLPNHIPDKFMYYLGRLLPEHLPKSLLAMRKDFEHHLIIKMSGEGIDELTQYLNAHFTDKKQGRYILCTDAEADKAMLHRFVVAGAAMRYQQINESEVEAILPLDVALKRNQENWVDDLPEEIAEAILAPVYYGHFFCHVFHRDYILKKGYSASKVKKQLLQLLEQQGAKYPAEHNVGHLYHAAEDQQAFYKSIDPTNSMNPGIGKMSKLKHYGNCCH